MYPYIDIGETKIYMTGLGVIVGLVFFLITSLYLSQKFKQNFRSLFYRIPVLIIITYLFGAYADFFLTTGLIPTNKEQLLNLFSPYGYKFHYTGLLIGFAISIWLFLNSIKRTESKRVRIDILFSSTAIAIIPLGLFLLLGDNFIGKTTQGHLAVTPLHIDSKLNKFSSVYPVGIFLSIGSMLAFVAFFILKRKIKKFGLGMIGFVFLLISINIVILFQQYPRHGIISVGGVSLDIKHHLSFLMIMLCLYVYNKYKEK